MKENERAEITEEVIGDTIDDAMADEGSEAQEDAIVNQVLDELGINVSESVPGTEYETAMSADSVVNCFKSCAVVAPLGPKSTPAESGAVETRGLYSQMFMLSKTTI